LVRRERDELFYWIPADAGMTTENYEVLDTL